MLFTSMFLVLQRNVSSQIPGLTVDHKLFHPRIMPPSMVNATSTEFQIQVRVIEARDLAGMTLDPVVTITLGEMKKNTTVKPQTNNPIWDEYFCMELIMTETQALDQMLKFDTYVVNLLLSKSACDSLYSSRAVLNLLFSDRVALVIGWDGGTRAEQELQLVEGQTE
eukprot:gene7847-13725_t